MQITLFTRDRDLGRTLADATGVPALPISGDRFEIGPLERVPGATESFWQLAVDIGLISAPIGVTCNLIASWIYDALKRVRPKQADVPASAHQVTVKLLIRVDDKTTDIALELGEVAVMARELEAAVARVDRQR
jgi:hypothetical protein